MVFEFGSLYGGSCLSRFVIVYCWLLRCMVGGYVIARCAVCLRLVVCV